MGYHHQHSNVSFYLSAVFTSTYPHAEDFIDSATSQSETNLISRNELDIHHKPIENTFIQNSLELTLYTYTVLIQPTVAALFTDGSKIRVLSRVILNSGHCSLHASSAAALINILQISILPSAPLNSLAIAPVKAPL